MLLPAHSLVGSVAQWLGCQSLAG